jgi:hypothetical protein
MGDGAGLALLDAPPTVPTSSRPVAVVNGLGEFAPAPEEALEVENADEVGKMVWLGDGAACNWTLADQLAPDAGQILDWRHALTADGPAGPKSAGGRPGFTRSSITCSMWAGFARCASKPASRARASSSWPA